jgi:nucleoside-diphosphate-sugar epimerase
MTVLLLGGNGLLGHNVLKLLLEQGYAVHALVRNPKGLQTETFPQAQTLLTVVKGSLLDDDDLRKAAEGCDAIVNCAGTTDMSLLHYNDYLPVNSNLCHRLVQLMAQVGITRLVHTSTANTIGYGEPNCPATETAPMKYPFTDSYYARSKSEGEAELLQAVEAHPDWHVVVLNPGFMVGAYDTKPSSGVLLLTGYRKPLMVCPKGGKSFVHVADAATAVVHAIERGESGKRYLLTGENLTLRQFYQLQAEVCRYRQKIVVLPNWVLQVAGRAGDMLRLCGVGTQVSSRNVRLLTVCEYYDNKQAVEELGMPQTPIKQAIADFFEWYLSNSKLKIEN